MNQVQRRREIAARVLEENVISDVRTALQASGRGYGEVVPSLGAHVFPISRIRMQRCLVLYDIYNDRKKLGELMHTIGETEHETTNFPITMSIICG
ncbi:Protein of unknown function [Pyronema omphalodes CBS 100304]|uniref:Uncharacterized protein n=1 Tax=Pyronema omphalodes (strain CBS 100304) TaxID=1076935 RepID=U4LQ99_PYROM|nr:Protein of unknown function [Pyronema omphalodes CBS 100304]